MIEFSSQIQRPLLDALRAICPQPTPETAFDCIWNKEIQQIAVDLARKVRHEVMEVDELLKNGSGFRVSYRGYIVGGLVVGLTQPWPNKGYHGWYAEPTHNTKPYERVEAFCSESRGIRFGHNAGHFCYCFFATSAKLQEDHGSGLVPKTRHLCDKCRAKARSPKYRQLFRDKTVSLTALPKEDIPEGQEDFWELYTIPDLCRLHGEPWPADAPP